MSAVIEVGDSASVDPRVSDDNPAASQQDVPLAVADIGPAIDADADVDLHDEASHSLAGAVIKAVGASATALTGNPLVQAKKLERRQEVRYLFHWRALVRWPNGKGLICRTLDVSKSGCCLVLAENCHPNQSVMLYLELPPAHSGLKGDVLCMDAWIARTTLSTQSGGFVVGLNFTKPTAPDLLRLHRQLATRSVKHL
jgi:hypothetical protein